MTLTPKIRQQLKALAHKLQPIVLIGNKGLTANVHNEIERALHDHELIKIRIAYQDGAERRAAHFRIAEHHHAEMVQCIGHIGVFFRKREPQKL